MNTWVSDAIGLLRQHWNVLATLVVTVFVAATGWIVAHRFTAARDFQNKKREIRIQYLIQAYRQLALSSQRPPAPKWFRDMEAAVADIQLFERPSQIEKVSVFLEEFSRQGKASMDALLTDLRDDLRQELQLDPVDGRVRWFRPEGGVDVPPGSPR
jgi:hypothetical protein